MMRKIIDKTRLLVAPILFITSISNAKAAADADRWNEGIVAGAGVWRESLKEMSFQIFAKSYGDSVKLCANQDCFVDRSNSRTPFNNTLWEIEVSDRNMSILYFKNKFTNTYLCDDGINSVRPGFLQAEKNSRAEWFIKKVSENSDWAFLEHSSGIRIDITDSHHGRASLIWMGRSDNNYLQFKLIVHHKEKKAIVPVNYFSLPHLLVSVISQDEDNWVENFSKYKFIYENPFFMSSAVNMLWYQKDIAQNAYETEMFNTLMAEEQFGLAYKAAKETVQGNLWKRQSLAQSKKAIKSLVRQQVYLQDVTATAELTQLMEGFVDTPAHAELQTYLETNRTQAQQLYSGFLANPQIQAITPEVKNMMLRQLFADMK